MEKNWKNAFDKAKKHEDKYKNISLNLKIKTLIKI